MEFVAKSASGSANFNSEWIPATKLRVIDEDISDYGYNKAFIDTHNLNEKLSYHCANDSGQVCFFEPLEVTAINGEVFYRENHDLQTEPPEVFKTQLGVFINHNHGEFPSWLEPEQDGFAESFGQNKTLHNYYAECADCLEGNFCEMLDCGVYTYAISNLLHGVFGYFKIVRFDKNLTPVVLFNNMDRRTSTALYNSNPEEKWIWLEYNGHYLNEEDFCIIASGYKEKCHGSEMEREQQGTLLFQIDHMGNCIIRKEWDIRLSRTNSLAAVGDYVYFGQNKMISRLNSSTGELTYFTNKSDAELAALSRL